MPISFRCKLKKLAHNGQISKEEYQDLIKKLDGHDKQIKADYEAECEKLFNDNPPMHFNREQIMWIKEYVKHARIDERANTIDKVLDTMSEIKKCGLYCFEYECSEDKNCKDCMYKAMVKAIKELK